MDIQGDHYLHNKDTYFRISSNKTGISL